VHIWRAILDRPEESIAYLWTLLADDERQRAERFLFPRDRAHFTVARGLLRVLLGHYLGSLPQHLRFAYGPHGKPVLTLATQGPHLHFNVSHSHGLALYACTWGRDIGVDVERIRPAVARENIAEHFFSPREVTTLRSLPPAVQATAFFACWTRKEAFIKAKGMGLTLPLHQFDVAFAPGESAALLRTAWDAQEVHYWSLRDLDPAPEYRAAVAVAGHDWRLTCWDIPPSWISP
jgi:4'-phosphopantetheinyl transferase